jgi:hypothetical protein
MRRALRPQAVRYDHSWFTNLLGQTSVPHRNPGSSRKRRESEGADEARPGCDS